jgi:rifampicin phosphotransferase
MISARNTDNLVVRKPAGPVLSRQIRQKTVLTTYAERGTEQVPVELSRRNEPVLDDAAAIELTGLAARIEEHYMGSARHRVGPSR